MHPFFLESIETIRAGLNEYITGRARTLLSLEPWGPDLHRRLGDYARRGKMVRGALVPFAYRLFRPGEAAPPACTQAGVAMELLQSFLLVHDDIMDQDETRRGAPAVHSQYEALLEGHSDARQFGLSMGICGGDVAAFLAMEQIATLPVDAQLQGELSALVAREIVTVGLAQMQDVHHGYISAVDTEAILNVYTYKTGRYTFSLPMMVGARLAGAASQQIEALAAIGENLGRIFQIRDDQLGIFGTSEEIGKPSGSDIREDKKTLFRDELFRVLPADHPIRGYFGSPRTGEDEIRLIRREILERGVQERVDTVVAAELQSVYRLVDSLTVSAEAVTALHALAQYNESRKR